MTTPTPDDRPVSNWPTITEKQWYMLAIIAVIFTTIVALFAVFWVFSEPDIDDQAKRVAVMAPFGTIPIAIITFCTVAWRGMVTSRQADQQLRQNDATDDANFAKLLQEGAKLLADEKTPNQLAGVASLSILLNEPKARYKAEALDVLAEAIRTLFSDTMDATKIAAIRRSSLFQNINVQLRAQSRSETFSNVVLTCSATAAENEDAMYWPNVFGFKECQFMGGNFYGNTRDLIAGNKSVFFKSAIIREDRVTVTGRTYRNCEFNICRVSELDRISLRLFGSKFIRCDFSGTRFDDKITPEEFNDDNCQLCWYNLSEPPISEVHQDWTRTFTPKLKINHRWVEVENMNGFEAELTEKERFLVKEFHQRKQRH